MPDIDNPEEFALAWTNEEFQTWLREQMNDERKWLLAHADDGVIWGRWSNNDLVTSHDVAPAVSPELRLITLQQVFIFGAQDEVRLWRDDDSATIRWRARRLSDRENDEVIYESQLLWGSEIKEWPAGFNGQDFTHVWEKASNYGMDHIVPIKVSLDDLKQRAVRLASPAKKSELLRAGIKALAAMSDAAYVHALDAVLAIKTGRPSKA